MNHWLLMSILLQGKQVHIGDDEWGTLEYIEPDWVITVSQPIGNGFKSCGEYDQDTVCVENKGYLYSVRELRELMK